MKSLKTKLIVIILTLVVVSSLSTVSIGLMEGFRLTENVVNTQTEDELVGADNMLKAYLKEQFGTFRIENNKLADEKGQPVDGRFDYIDQLSQNMNVVATVFVKTGSDYTRVLTTVKDEQGKRVIGTALDTKGKAYESITNGKDYLGEADILGKKYITRYSPLLDNNKQCIGVSFVGVPIEKITAMINEGKASTIQSVVFLSIIVLIVVAIIGYFVALSISKPIKKMTNAAQKIADGDFNVELSIKSKDEIGRLAQSLNLTVVQLTNYQGYIDEIADTLMKLSEGDLTVELQREYVGQFKKLKDHMLLVTKSLKSTLQNINQSADQVASGAEQVANGAQLLSQGATEQASSIEELSATIGEMTQQIHQNEQNVHTTNQMMEETRQEVVVGNKKMQEMISAMKEISATSNEISKIIKTIEDIAFQTNILALNAAVEAARAGEAGKGFAVVADEVRNLAQKSADAAKNTTTLIQSAICAVGNGAKIADDTANSLSVVVSKTNQITQQIEEIAAASVHQAEGANQITIGAEQISSVVQTNSATAEESAAASEQLSGQAQVMKDMVSKFKL